MRVTSTPDAATHHNRHVKPRYVHFLPSIANRGAVLQGPPAQRLSLNIKRVFAFPLNQKTEAQPCPHCRIERASEGHLKDSIFRWGGGGGAIKVESRTARSCRVALLPLAQTAHRPMQMNPGLHQRFGNPKAFPGEKAI